MYYFFRNSLFVFLLVCLWTEFSSCRKDKIITDASAKLHFSADSVLFDTVFTGTGSSTRHIKVRNRNKQRIKISNIHLEKGNASQFIINVDGIKGNSVSDVEIAANDSIYIFIQVNVNPTSPASPFIISDAIVFNTNGNVQQVYLEAWGQNAYYHRPTNAIKFKDGSYLPYSLISNNPNVDTLWPNDKPHVIYGWLVIDSHQKLTIAAGSRLYFNSKAGLWVFRYGQLKVMGTLGNEVLFTGARLEYEYSNEPGQWDRIWINEGSVNNEINYAIIKNGFIGIQAELLGDTLNVPKRLKITNTRIQNMSKWGLYAFAFNVNGGNNVITNCGEHCVNIALGGNYRFVHCTFANFWSKSNRELPTIKVNNFFPSQVLPLDTCYFGNCIIDGKLTNEIDLNLNSGNPSFLPKYFFSNCVLKTTLNTSDASKFAGNKINAPCNYEDPEKYLFKLKSNSQAGPFNQGNAFTDAFLYPQDITGTVRTTTIWAGAYMKPD